MLSWQMGWFRSIEEDGQETAMDASVLRVSQSCLLLSKTLRERHISFLDCWLRIAR